MAAVQVVRPFVTRWHNRATHRGGRGGVARVRPYRRSDDSDSDGPPPAGPPAPPPAPAPAVPPANPPRIITFPELLAFAQQQVMTCPRTQHTMSVLIQRCVARARKGGLDSEVQITAWAARAAMGAMGAGAAEDVHPVEYQYARNLGDPLIQERLNDLNCAAAGRPLPVVEWYSVWGCLWLTLLWGCSGFILYHLFSDLRGDPTFVHWGFSVGSVIVAVLCVRRWARYFSGPPPRYNLDGWQLPAK
jgi:hypothetical protein